MKNLFILVMAICFTLTLNAKTLVVYYSFTNNTHAIATDLQAQLSDADAIRIEPAQEGLDYAANGYELGSALIAAIRENPDDASSYPEIKPVTINFADYSEIIVATPLWWGNMAAPMQTFLFHNGHQMAGKQIGLIVSSASSGISGVEADAQRLIPDGIFIAPSLWIRSAQTSNCHEMITEWLDETGFGNSSSITGITVDREADISCNGDMLTVDYDFDIICLYDTAGRTVLETTDKATDISLLPAGIYLVYVGKGQTETAAKIIVK